MGNLFKFIESTIFETEETQQETEKKDAPQPQATEGQQQQLAQSAPAAEVGTLI